MNIPNTMPSAAHLPTDYQDVLDFAYYSGWRRREILELTWAEVDLQIGEVQLPAERSKTDQPGLLPLSAPLRAVIDSISAGSTPRSSSISTANRSGTG